MTPYGPTRRREWTARVKAFMTDRGLRRYSGGAPWRRAEGLPRIDHLEAFIGGGRQVLVSEPYIIDVVDVPAWKEAVLRWAEENEYTTVEFLPPAASLHAPEVPFIYPVVLMRGTSKREKRRDIY